MQVTQRSVNARSVPRHPEKLAGEFALLLVPTLRYNRVWVFSTYVAKVRR